MPIPVRLRLYENATSMLHLYLPYKGCFQQLEAACAVQLPVSEAVAECSPSWGWCTCCWVAEAAMLEAFARCQSSTEFYARSTTMALTSVASSQTFRLQCFQRLHNVVANRWFCSADNVSNNKKIVSAAEVVDWIECWMAPQIPIIYQTWTTKGQ